MQIPLLGLLPTVTSETEINSLPNEDEKFLRHMISLSQQKYRQFLWLPLKNSRLPQDPEKSQSDSIMTNDDLVNLKKTADKIILNSVRIAALNRNTSLVTEYCKMIQMTKTLQLVSKLLDEMKLPGCAN